MMLNCQTLEARYLPLPKKTRLVICNTLVKHDLALSTYNERRAECEEAARRLGITSLSNISFAEFQDRVGKLPPTLRKRSRHVVTENARVEEAAEALEQGDLEAFGEAMNESHLSLQNDFEVSCYELDLMVKLARAHPATYGARMTGGGFGGCTINLVRGEAVEHFTEQVSRGYKHETGITPALYVCRAGPGAAEVAGI
jgi:galactokinase